MEFLKKPISYVKEKAENESVVKSVIKFAIFCVILTIMSLITKISETIILRKHSSSFQFCSIDEISFKNLKDFSWFSNIFGTLIIFILVAFGISLVLYLVSKFIFKKEEQYDTFLKIISNAYMYYVVLVTIGTILGILYEPWLLYFSRAAFIITSLIVVFICNEIFEEETEKLIIIVTVLGTLFYIGNYCLTRYEIYKEAEEEMSDLADEFKEYSEGIFEDPEDFIK